MWQLLIFLISISNFIKLYPLIPLQFINFMGSNLTDEKIEDYLSKCKHVDARSSTPPGFWNPLMVSFAEGDPRNEVLIDTRFRNQRLNK